MSTRPARWLLHVLAVSGVALVGARQAAQACALDGVPSISANGVLARINTALPASADLARWAPFVFPQAVKAGALVRLAEDRRAVLLSLPPQAFDRPWRWTFGDRTGAIGFAPVHRYAHPGAYVLTVWAYDAPSRRWYRFDEARIRIR